jgi:S1-C subfamily serine protease
MKKPIFKLKKAVLLSYAFVLTQASIAAPTADNAKKTNTASKSTVVKLVPVKEIVATSLKSDVLTPDEAVNVRVYKMANRAVVNISRTTDNDLFFNVVPEQGIGSGVIISEEGYILTNFHVIENANAIKVTLWDGTTLRGALVGQDPSNDLAVIKIEVPKGMRLTITPFGDSSKLEVGRRVFAIGNPFGFDRTMTTGIVSSLGRTLKSENNRIIKGVIQTDAAINPGNSGGPLLDSSARLIGINTAILSKSGQSAGIGLAIPANIAKRIIPELIAHHFVSRPEIGLQCIETDGALRVAYVDPDGAAGKAGLTGPKVVLYKLPAGVIQMVDNSLADIITAVDSVVVKSNDDLLSYIEQKKAGQVVTLTVLRNKKVVKIPVKLTAASPA